MASRESAWSHVREHQAELLTRQATVSGITALQLLQCIGIDHDRYHNGGVQEVIGIALCDGDDAEWIAAMLRKVGPS